MRINNRVKIVIKQKQLNIKGNIFEYSYEVASLGHVFQVIKNLEGTITRFKKSFFDKEKFILIVNINDKEQFAVNFCKSLNDSLFEILLIK